MKKFLLLASLSVVVVTTALSTANAQSVKGKTFVNAGIGIGSFGFSGTGGIPITASFEHGFTDEISGGGFAGIIRRKLADDYTYSYFVAGAKASYHVNEALDVENPKLDLYGGASLFYRGFKLKSPNKQPEADFKASGGNIGIGFHAGARYLFSQTVGGYAELGYGISPLQIGLSLIF